MIEKRIHDYTESSDTYVIVQDKKGSDFLCPSRAGSDDYSELDMNVCFEKDVPERYAGRINIKKFYGI